jgi:hypothetical protein
MCTSTRRSLVAIAGLLAVLLLAGCDFTSESTERRRKFDDVGEIDVYGREETFSYGGKHVQEGRPASDPQYVGRKHAYEVGEISIDDEPVVRPQRRAPRVYMERVHPSVSIQPRNAPAPRPAPEYRVNRPATGTSS